MLSDRDRELALRYLPIILKDEKEPFTMKWIGITVFDEGTIHSRTFQKLQMDMLPPECRLAIEYAIYWDYDIQHMYDLEHIWVGIGHDDKVMDCYSSFHGMLIHASGVKGMYRTREGRPVLYMQPGKHAFMPDPELFGLAPHKEECCNVLAGGGLLTPQMFGDRLSTNPRQDNSIRDYIRRSFSFRPSWSFIEEKISEDQLMSADDLMDQIPRFIDEELSRMREHLGNEG